MPQQTVELCLRHRLIVGADEAVVGQQPEQANLAAEHHPSHMEVTAKQQLVPYFLLQTSDGNNIVEIIRQGKCSPVPMYQPSVCLSTYFPSPSVYNVRAEP